MPLGALSANGVPGGPRFLELCLREGSVLGPRAFTTQLRAPGRTSEGGRPPAALGSGRGCAPAGPRSEVCGGPTRGPGSAAPASPGTASSSGGGPHPARGAAGRGHGAAGGADRGPGRP